VPVGRESGSLGGSRWNFDPVLGGVFGGWDVALMVGSLDRTNAMCAIFKNTELTHP